LRHPREWVSLAVFLFQRIVVGEDVVISKLFLLGLLSLLFLFNRLLVLESVVLIEIGIDVLELLIAD
jgi:hypothetical protein